MKLFFSYGHDKNEDIVLRLKSDLEKRKHSVWIDKSQIKGGDDWRRTITSGILDSEFMMSFASNHSLRKPGVCLDELMIAVSVKGAQIQTVLLEADIIPPANIGYRQYIDMSRWNILWGTDEFEAWYNDKLNEIIRIIESPETAKYAEEIEFIKNQLHPNLSSTKKDRLQREYFCGREWLSKRVLDWLCDRDASRILLIDGSPGIGKSSFMAHEFIFNASVGSILFCEWDNPGFNSLDSISRCMVFQLASKLTDYRSQIVRYLKRTQQQESTYSNLENSEGVFRFLLLQQLRSLIDGERPMIIILIDGIDELEEKDDGGRRRNIFAELLQQEIEDFPRWIRFVVTSRCDSKVTMPLKNVAVIHMDESVGNNTQDVRQYLDHELEEKLSPEEITQITRKCDGNFLYAKMTVDAIKSEKLSVMDVLEGKTGDLGFIYRHYFDRTFQNMDEYEEIYYSVIAALAVTEERIPDSTFRNITGWPRRKYQHFMKVISPFLAPGREYLGLYHKSIQDWILSENADDYMVDALDGFREIGKGCLQSYEDNMHAMNDYELKYLISCLERTDDKRIQSIIVNAEYADLLLDRAKSKALVFRYEDAVVFGEMSWNIYRNTGMYEKAAATGLFLAEITNRMVNLEESKQWCEEALAVTEQDTHLAKSSLPGDIWMRLAYVEFCQGEWEKSIISYRKAYECFADCVNIQERQRELKKIEAMMMCANALRNATDFTESIRIFEEIEALPVYKTLKGSENDLYTSILMFHGWALHSAARYTEAAEYLENAEKMCDCVDLPLADIAQIYYLRAIELFNKANYVLAEEYCEKSLYYVKQAYGENAVEVCSALNQMGAIAQKQDNHEKAIKIFKRSYEIRKNYYGENNLFTTISLRNYAKALIRLENPENLDEVGYILEKIRRFRERIAESGKGIGWLAQIYLDLADYYRAIHNYTEAEMYVSKSGILYDEHGSIRDISACEMQKGMIKFEEGDYVLAKEAFERAYALNEKCYDASHPYLLELRKWLEKTENLLKPSVG